VATYVTTQASSTSAVTRTTYAFLGQADAQTSGTSVQASTTIAQFDDTETYTLGSFVGANWAVSANTPLNGFFKAPDGSIYLRSASGQLVYWPANTGALRVAYVQPQSGG
jgi:hypothetical protein